MVKRDKHGRVMCRVDGVQSDRVFSIRLTQKEYDLISHARQSGHDPREILLSQIKKVVQHDKSKT